LVELLVPVASLDCQKGSTRTCNPHHELALLVSCQKESLLSSTGVADELALLVSFLEDRRSQRSQRSRRSGQQSNWRCHHWLLGHSMAQLEVLAHPMRPGPGRFPSSRTLSSPFAARARANARALLLARSLASLTPAARLGQPGQVVPPMHYLAQQCQMLSVLEVGCPAKSEWEMGCPGMH
jgi:hypothetical protein